MERDGLPMAFSAWNDSRSTSATVDSRGLVKGDAIGCISGGRNGLPSHMHRSDISASEQDFKYILGHLIVGESETQECVPVIKSSVFRITGDIFFVDA